MYDFTADARAIDKLTQDPQTDVWLLLPLRGYGASPLTPFSNSVTCGIARRAVRSYYEQLQFEPEVNRDFVQSVNGYAYLNIGAMAQLETAHANVEPPILRINSQLAPLAQAKKTGLFGGLKASRTQKRMDSLLQEMAQGIESTAKFASSWFKRARETHWTQAEILQVMEEVERVGTQSMTAFLTAQYNLVRLYTRLLAVMQPKLDTVQSLSLINAALGDVDSLAESELAMALLELAQAIPLDEQTAEWLSQDSFAEWQDSEVIATKTELTEGLMAFLAVYGHRRTDETEMSQPRWYEEPAPVMHALLSTLRQKPARPSKIPTNGYMKKLAELVDDSLGTSAADVTESIRTLHHVQSHALHAIAYVWAGTREWAKAAAHETVGDGRLEDEADIFYFELEEIKQMMTGEWNISDVEGIRSTVEQRRATHQARCEERSAPPLFIAEFPAQNAILGLPGSSGSVTAPLRRLRNMDTDGCGDAILGADHLSSGWAITTPVVDGYIARRGTPIEPCVVAARVWHRPVVVAMGQEYDDLLEGAQTSVDGDRAQVEQ